MEVRTGRFEPFPVSPRSRYGGAHATSQIVAVQLAGRFKGAAYGGVRRPRKTLDEHPSLRYMGELPIEELAEAGFRKRA